MTICLTGHKSFVIWAFHPSIMAFHSLLLELGHYFLFERFETITIFYCFENNWPYFWSYVRYGLGTISYRTEISTLKNVSFSNIRYIRFLTCYSQYKVINYVKICKFWWLNSEYFYDELKMTYFFLEANKTMICSRSKQFLMPCHEDDWSYYSMFLNETSKLKDNN